MPFKKAADKNPKKKNIIKRKKVNDKRSSVKQLAKAERLKLES